MTPPSNPHKAYSELTANALAALPRDIPQGVKDFMGKKVQATLAPDSFLRQTETSLMANLWATMGYQDSLRYLFDAVMILAANESPEDAPSSTGRAQLAWPALYANLTGYAHLFNRTSVPYRRFTHDVEEVTLSDKSAAEHAYFGTIQQPGPGVAPTRSNFQYPVKRLLEEMTEMGAHRLAAQGNDRDWDRARFDTELELYAASLRAFLGQPAAKPTMPQDPHVLIPDGFTHFPYDNSPNDRDNPNAHIPHDRPAGGLEHLPAPIALNNPLPTTLATELGITPTPAKPYLFTTPAPAPKAPRAPRLPAPSTNPARIWKKIEKLLGDEATTLLAPGATEEELTTLEHHLGYPLPTQLRQALAHHNGTTNTHPQLPGEELLSTHRIAEEHDTNTDAYQDTNQDILNNPHPDTATHFAPGTTQPGIWNARWIPITADGNGNNLALDTHPGPTGHTGQILTLNHNQPHTGPTLPSYAALLTTWAHNLKNNA